MRQLLKKLGFDFNDSDLSGLAQLFAGAQRQRLLPKKKGTERVTRSTAIVALAQVAPNIEKRLSEAGLNWQLFRGDVRLPEKIIPIETDDVVLATYFEAALKRFAKKHQDRRRASPENFASAIVEMVTQDPGTGKLGKRLEASGVDSASLPTDFTEPEPKPDPEAERPRPRRVAWICQFKKDERGGDLLRERGPGKKLDWQWATHVYRNTMRAGDPVVYLRQIGEGKDRGGIVGTGRVVSNEPVENSVLSDKGASRLVDGLATEIVETFVDDLIPRDKVFTDPPFPKDKVWRGAIVKLTEKQALRINEVLLEHQNK